MMTRLTRTPAWLRSSLRRRPGIRRSSTRTCASFVASGKETAASSRLTLPAQGSMAWSTRRWLQQQPPSVRTLSTAAQDASDNKTPFFLADIGEGIKEVELLQWYVHEGDPIQQFDTVCQVQSDKATVDITSRYTGTITSLAGHAPGDIVQVGDVLAYFETDDASVAPLIEESNDEVSAEAEEEERLHIPTIASQYHLPSDEPAAAAVEVSERVTTSPAVRKLGKEYKLDLSTIQGTGPHGRLLKSDVLTYLQEQGLKPPPPKKAPVPKAEPTAISATVESTLLPPVEEEGAIFTLKGYHRQMVSTMTAALETPHMCFADEIEMDQLIQCRHDLNSNITDDDSKISLLALMLKACSLALAQYPVLNAVVHSVEDCQLKLLSSHNLGVAMDTPRGLVVPSIRRVQEKSVRDIQAELDRLKALAADNLLSMEDLQPGPTFTLSNIGSIGGTYMQPVIVPPTVAIGALGKILRVPRFAETEDGSESMTVVSVKVMNVSWAGDHRFLDGATLARFNAAFKSYVEDPVLMLAEMK